MGTPNYPRDFASEFNRVRREVKNAFTSANLRTGMAKIGAKVIEITGELALNAGAILRAEYDNGVDALFIGKHTYNGNPVGKFSIKRYDGTEALQIFGGANEAGFFSIQDRNGNIIMSDDSVSGTGLATPWVPYGHVRTAKLTAPDDLSTSASFSAHHTFGSKLQHPKFRVFGYVICNGADVAEIRVRNPATGNVLATSGSVTSGWLTLEGAPDDYTHMANFNYDIEVRRVSGTSTGVGFTPLVVYGRQS